MTDLFNENEHRYLCEIKEIEKRAKTKNTVTVLIGVVGVVLLTSIAPYLLSSLEKTFLDVVVVLYVLLVGWKVWRVIATSDIAVHRVNREYRFIRDLNNMTKKEVDEIKE